MIFLIIASLILVPGIGAGVVVFVQKDAQCRHQHKPTRVTGAMLETYCDESEK